MNAKIIISLVVGLIVHQCPMSYGQLEMAFTMFEKVNTIHDVNGKLTTPSTADLMDAAEEMVEKVDKLQDTLGKVKNALESLIVGLHNAQKISANVEKLNELISRIEVLYEEFEDYIDEPESFNELDLEKMVTTFASLAHNDVMGTLGQINGLIAGKKLSKYRKGLFYNLAKESQDNDLELCDTGASPQRRLLELFNILVDTETRGSVMMSFGITMEAYLKNVTPEGAIRRAQEKLLERGEGYLKVLTESLKIAPTQFRRCDPRANRRRTTFHEFERFLTTFMAQETLLSRWHTCAGGGCTGHSQPTQVYPGCKGFECSGSPTTCYGRVFGCETIPATQICEYDTLQARRYAWYKIRNDEYGNPQEGCLDGTIYGAGSFHHSNGEDVNLCELCRCTCVEDGSRSWASRFISMRKQITNLKDNKVAVGFQLVMKDKFLHIRVMEGKLGPKGMIVEDTSSWIEFENIQLKSDGKIVKISGGNEEEMVRDEDVAVFELEHKRINLDTLSVPEGYILTGARFGRTKSDRSHPVQLEIHGTRFTYETGELDPDDTIWIASEDPDDRERLPQEGLRSPLMVKGTTIVDPQRDVSIDLSMSDRVTDAGQTVLPLLDALPVMGEPPAPLVGLGLYYKAVEEYGGFLTLILEEINRAPHLSTYKKVEF